MKSLFAIAYPTLESAQAGLDLVKQLSRGETITLIDAALVTRGEDGSVKLHQSINTTLIGAASGAFWGSLVGLIFLSPALGALVGGGAGALSGYLSDYGISDDFMRETGQKQSGQGATLFVLAADLTPDKVAQALGKSGGDVVYTSMPTDIEARFKAGFVANPLAPSPAVAAQNH